MTKSKKIDVAAIGAHMISQQFAVACLFQTLARVQPTIAKEIAQELQKNLRQVDVRQYPGVRVSVEEYISLLESQAAKALQ